MQRTIYLFAGLALCATSSLPAHAADQPGFYAKLQVGQLEQDFTPASSLAIEGVDAHTDNSDVGASLSVGYHINRYLSAELAYLNSGTATLDTHWPPMGGGLAGHWRDSSRVTGPAISLVPTLPIADRWQLHMQLGAFFATDKVTSHLFSSDFRSSQSESSATWLGGLGLGFAVTDRCSLDLDYFRSGDFDVPHLANDHDNHLSGVTFGLRYQF